MQGFLFPDVPALAARGHDGRLHVVDFSRPIALIAEGVLADDVLALLTTRIMSPRLSLLEKTARDAVTSLSEASRVPLEPGAVLKMDGYGTLFVELTGACNQSCTHCYAGANPEPGQMLDRGTCERVLDDAASLGFEYVQFTGGEPLLCPDLPALLEHAGRLDGLSCEIFTNGLLLDDDMLRRIESTKPSLAFSFYSHIPAVHDGITRSAGSQEATIRAMEGALARDFAVRASVVVMAENEKQVTETVGFLKSMGVEKVGVSGVSSVGRGTYFSSLDALCTLEDNPRSPGRRMLGNLCLSPDGSVYPCIFNREDLLGRVPGRSLAQIAEDPWLPAETVTEQESFMLDCRRRLQCINCQATAYALRMCTARRRS